MLIVDQGKSIKKDILSYIAITLFLLISSIAITFNEIAKNNTIYVLRLVTILLVLINLCLFLGLKQKRCDNIIPYVVIEIINILSFVTFMICMGNPFIEIFDDTLNKIIAFSFISISLISIYKGFVEISNIRHSDPGIETYYKQSNKGYIVYSSVFISVFLTLSIIDGCLNKTVFYSNIFLSGVFTGFIILQIIFKTLFLGNSQEIFCAFTKSLLIIPMLTSYYFGATLRFGYGDKVSFFLCIIVYVSIIVNVIGDWIFIFKNFKQRIS